MNINHNIHENDSKQSQKSCGNYKGKTNDTKGNSDTIRWDSKSSNSRKCNNYDHNRTNNPGLNSSLTDDKSSDNSNRLSNRLWKSCSCFLQQFHCNHHENGFNKRRKRHTFSCG